MTIYPIFFKSMVNIQVIDPPLTPPVEGGEFKMCPPVVGREKELMNS